MEEFNILRVKIRYTCEKCCPRNFCCTFLFTLAFFLYVVFLVQNYAKRPRASDTENQWYNIISWYLKQMLY